MIPTLVAISLLAFVISVNAPGDPVDRLLSVAENSSGDALASGGNRDETKKEIIKNLGLDLPLFYMSFGTMAENNQLHSITDNKKRKNLLHIARVSGRPDEVVKLDSSIHQLNIKIDELLQNDSLRNSGEFNDSVLPKLSAQSLQLFSIGTYTKFKENADSLILTLSEVDEVELKKTAEAVLINLNFIIEKPKKWKTYIPKIEFYGLNNQYHRWVFGDNKTSKGIIRGDFGISYRDGQKISDRIGKKMKWSLLLAVVSIFLSYLISIPVGLYAGYRANSRFDRISGLLLFALYSLPGFFVGTLLLVLFANPDFYDWFPESGVKDPAVFSAEWNIFQRLSHYAPYLVLPIITYTYSSFAFISRQMRGGIVDAMKMDYIRTARAKGLNEKQVLIKHAFRNALLPIITIFSSIFPLAFGGSIIIETIFSIPGMGLEIYESIQNYDYPMIVAVFTIFGFLTIFGYFIGDVLYAKADPRINLSQKN
jgi:peptide/nickel transport system permease protein